MTPEDWTRVKQLALDAWERPAGDRTSYLERACAGNEALQREVLSLVASMVESEGRFEVPPAAPLDQAGAMDTLTGRTIGAYEILGRIGAGGMGDVYKARDARLDRIVAIKVLAAGAGTDPLSRERIAHEARAVAALSHPHICTAYDVGSQDGVDYFVMEFVNGETLATQLSRGFLPVREALRYGEQIAAALGEAHRAGIVHRDVKPANIMLHAGADGSTQAKLLDFGVAKANARAAVRPVHAQPGTADVHQTTAGVIVGTPHYMAPEQLDGVPTDRRTDIFAFGAVLFEMLTARKAFAGASRNDVLAAIRSGGVPLPSQCRPGVPSAVDRVVSRCLAPDAKERYQSADDLLTDLRSARRRLDSSRWWRTTAAASILLVATGGAAAWRLGGRDTSAQPAAAPSLVRLAASAGVFGAPALSPDGSRLVFSWVGAGIDNPELVILPVGSTTRRRLTNDPGVEEWPAWSPNGKEVAFIRCGVDACGIFALRVDEGGERKIRHLRVDRYTSLSWSPDGRSIVYGERAATSDPYSLVELALHDSSTRRLTSPAGGSVGDLRFAFSPDGRELAIIRVEQRGIGVHVLSLATGAERPVLQRQREWFGGIAWSHDGRDLIVSANQQGVRRLWTVPARGGALEQLAIAGEDAYYPYAQGNRLVFVRNFSDWDLAGMTLAHGKLNASAPFPSSNRLDLDPAFSPDGRKLAFISARSGSREVWVSNADGSGASQLTSLNGPIAGRPSWSPDGRWIAFHSEGIQVIPAAGGPARRLYEDGELPTWSADGASIYFIRNRGAFSLWKIPAAGGTPSQVPTSEPSGALEAPGTGDLYVLRKEGIWRRPRTGGGEHPVIGGSTFSLPGYWAVTGSGIYYVLRRLGPNSTLIHQLSFYDFSRRRAIDLGTLPGHFEDWVGGLTVSPDRRTVVYSQRTYDSSEIMLVEQFR